MLNSVLRSILFQIWKDTVWTKNLDARQQPLPKHRQPLGMMQAFSLAVTTWKKLSSEYFTSKAAQQCDHVKSIGRNKRKKNLNTVKR